MISIRTISLRTRRLVFWWLGVLLVMSPAMLSGDETYIVRRNDTLYSIARQHGVTVTQLTERNGLSRSGWIQAGQRLVIPKDSPARTTRAGITPSVQRSIATARVTPRRWRRVVIHHSGVDSGTVKGMDRYHRDVRHMENGLAYHFVIGNGHGMEDGEIAVGRRWREQLDGGHLASEAQNRFSIGICLVGNFDKQKPTAKQMQSLTALVKSLLQRCDLTVSAVKTHQQINVIGTRCPGRQFAIKAFLKTLND
jgi:LysM repeat protein